MDLRVIKATFACDGCGKPFDVEIDPASATAGWSAYDYAVDAIRGDFFASLEGTDENQALCPTCTQKVDAFVGEVDRRATDEEIDEALTPDAAP